MTKHNRHLFVSAKSAGFTIVELVVVLTIIGILTTMTAVTYMQTQKEARDTKRNADITLMQNELEKYYDKHGEYPPGCPASTCTDAPLTANLSTTIDIDSLATITELRTALPGIPNDFGDPRYPGQPPMGVSSSTTRKYFYYGGTVNYTGVSSSLTKVSPAPACHVNSGLAAGQVGSYVLGYFSELKNQWVLKAGINGDQMTITSGNAADGCVIIKS